MAQLAAISKAFRGAYQSGIVWRLFCIRHFPAQATEAEAAGVVLNLKWFQHHADPKILISINRLFIEPSATDASATLHLSRRDIWNDVAIWGNEEEGEPGAFNRDFDAEGGHKSSDMPETLIELPRKYQVACRAHESVSTVSQRLRGVLNQTMLLVTTFNLGGTQARTASVPVPPLGKSGILGLSTALGSHFVIARDGDRSIHWLLGQSGMPLQEDRGRADRILFPAVIAGQSLDLKVDVLMSCNLPSSQ